MPTKPEKFGGFTHMPNNNNVSLTRVEWVPGRVIVDADGLSSLLAWKFGDMHCRPSGGSQVGQSLGVKITQALGRNAKKSAKPGTVHGSMRLSSWSSFVVENRCRQAIGIAPHPTPMHIGATHSCRLVYARTPEIPILRIRTCAYGSFQRIYLENCSGNNFSVQCNVVGKAVPGG